MQSGEKVRPLEIMDPDMSGPDVSDWQTFLIRRGLLAGTADGHFGPLSEAATFSYQTSAGLTVDGIVGPLTIAHARSDGYLSTTRADISGMDSDANCTVFAGELAQRGMQFVARYYSDNPSKSLTAGETQALSNEGLKIVAVFEDSNNAVRFFSSDEGNRQGAKALDFAGEIAQPAGSAIYFAVDYDATPEDVEGPVTDYFTAIKNAFVATPYMVGVYGSGLTCRVIRDANLAQFTWLTESTGFREYAAFRTQADIVQLTPQRKLFAGLDIDDDIAQSAEFGAFILPRALTALPTD